ncbi:MAG: LysM peptidoglycan-binding domain-containing protein [Chloroflexota bacterium]
MNASKTPVQQCPICRAQQPLEATRCSNCGAVLTGVPVLAVKRRMSRPRSLARTPLEGPAHADWDEGEADLHEGMLPTLPLRAVIFTGAVLTLMVGLIVFLGVQMGVINLNSTPTPVSTRRPPGIAAAQAAPIPTNTKSLIPVVIPTLPALETVTPAPATATITPTRGPCIQKAGKGDTVYAMAARCGHKHLSIVDVIIADNNLKSANSLQEGQTLEIPWPTPTGGAVSEPDSAGKTPGADEVRAEATLPAGVKWYTVRKGDTAISILVVVKSTIKTLRDLNPEIQFLQCDFGQPFGGSTCTLKPLLGEGQKIRVPAPLPTATLSPTFSGSETVTPTGTATFNAPFSQSPDDNMLYESSELPALRWVASGQLDANQVYLITIIDKTISTTYTGTTRELSFQVPTDWQPSDGKPHKFEWTVAVASKNDAGTAIPSVLQTEPRTFTWHSR